MKKLLLFLGVGGLAYGVYNFYAKQVELLNYLSYKIVGIKIINTTVENIDLEVLLEIQNNSEINLTITDYYFDVFINGIAVVIGLGLFYADYVLFGQWKLHWYLVMELMGRILKSF